MPDRLKPMLRRLTLGVLWASLPAFLCAAQTVKTGSNPVTELPPRDHPLLTWDSEVQTLVHAPPGRGAWYPRMLVLPDGRWLLAYDTNIDTRVGNGHTYIQVLESGDNGQTWQPLSIASFGHEVADAANPSITYGDDGTIYLAYRLVEVDHFEIRVSVSRDGGRTFKHLATVATGRHGLWEPAIGWVGNELWVLYSSEEHAPKYPQVIALRRSTDGGITWEPEEIVARNPRSRDGMASWTLVDGTIYLAYEATDMSNPFVIKMIRSTDGGRTWSQPAVVYQPPDRTRRASAPALAVLSCEGSSPAPLLVVAFQTDEDSLWGVGDFFTDIKYVWSLDGGRTWSRSYPALVTDWPDQWTGLTALANGAVVLLASSGDQIVMRKTQVGPCAHAQAAGSAPKPQPTTYRNPVLLPVAADPAVIRAPHGEYYVFATQDNWGDGNPDHLIPIFRSRDLVQWTYVGDVFQALPRWKRTWGYLWAPDVSYIAGEFRLYYAFSQWGDPNPCIGLATAPRPEGPWTDLGRPVFCSDEVGVPNSIDPFVWHDKTGSIIIWGSMHGIYAAPLSPDGTRLAGPKQLLAGSGYEGAYVYRKGRYYYLFLSRGSCCEGPYSTYALYVGRSEQLLGPYVDAQGRDLRDQGGTLVLAANEHWVGPGHNSVIADACGNDWLVYHAIPPHDPWLPTGATRRQGLIDHIEWVDGWPVVNAGRGPSSGPMPAPAVACTDSVTARSLKGR